MIEKVKEIVESTPPDESSVAEEIYICNTNPKKKEFCCFVRYHSGRIDAQAQAFFSIPIEIYDYKDNTWEEIKTEMTSLVEDGWIRKQRTEDGTGWV
uniref:Uncharacterized protein n=1 Tax=Pithovirus LCPAC304 TaxID=2506594 RepID=A0A481Z9V5_9VIRU|nr:MAG: hypothetical protein LCPAC304_06120 [Pithovirus LCPAC304]